VEEARTCSLTVKLSQDGTSVKEVIVAAAFKGTLDDRKENYQAVEGRVMWEKKARY
jgi:hypothetical protein